MANDSIQNEIPASRVNIRVIKDTDGAQEKEELPQRVLVMGDFTLKEDETALDEMEKIEVNDRNYDSVMERMNLELNMDVKDRLSNAENAEIKANLKFKKMGDFRPESIVEQVPELQQLAQIRSLLNDLKARVINNKQFRNELQRILQNKGLSEELISELSGIVNSQETKSE